MIIRNFYDDRLAQASYLVGCAATGEAIVIDPLRNVEQYLEMAKNQGLKITAIAETHIHADYLSGSRELSARTGATMFLSDEGTTDWKYAFADEPSVHLVKDQDVITVGNLTLKVLHTPGHTPEHISFLLTDHPASDQPHSLFTGDFIFVGDVGRPDLLERAANFLGSMEAGARVLYNSLQSLQGLPDELLLWPAHGAGSACGKSLGGSPVTTLGYERKSNWAFQIHDENSFVEEVLAGQPEPPAYFKMMKTLNKQGPRILMGQQEVPQLYEPIGELVDVRDADVIRAQMFIGAIAIPAGRGLANWAGWFLDYEQPVTVIASNAAEAIAARDAMMLIGLDIIAGWIHPDQVTLKAQKIEPVACSGLCPDNFVLDVRGINEWNTTHLDQAHHIPLGSLPSRLAELPKDQTIVAHCAGGMRSPIAISLLLASGFTHVKEISGGVNEIRQKCPTLLCNF
jgi:hydroxyacylglutathione hydrolase